MKLNKRFISLIICVLVLSLLTCFTVSAKVTYVSGNFVYEKINNNTEIEIDEYIGDDKLDFTFSAYNELPIVSIGTNAFSGNTTLETFYLSDVMRCIQSYAFLNAISLKNVYCGTSIELIDDFAFAGCTSLSSIDLENTVLSEVSDNCFLNCDSLTEVTIPKTAIKIGSRAFAECDSLCKVVIPVSVTEISYNAFDNSTNVVIYCYTDSAAHIYAETNSIEYVLLDAEPARTYILGDIDSDGEVAIMDATRIQLILVERFKDYTDDDVIRGDIEKDGVLSIMDVTSIQRYIAAYDDGYRIGETFEF